MLMWTIAMCIVLVAWGGEQVSSNEFVGLIASFWNSNNPNQNGIRFFSLLKFSLHIKGVGCELIT
jgi:hypothetical protein